LAPMFDYAARRRKLAEEMQREGVDALFLGLSSDLEYLTGLERNIPTFGNVSYAHGWVGGAFFRPGKEPTFLLPRMFAEFDLPHGAPGELVIVKETDRLQDLMNRLLTPSRLPRIGPLNVRNSRPQAYSSL